MQAAAVVLASLWANSQSRFCRLPTNAGPKAAIDSWLWILSGSLRSCRRRGRPSTTRHGARHATRSTRTRRSSGRSRWCSRRPSRSSSTRRAPADRARLGDAPDLPAPDGSGRARRGAGPASSRGGRRAQRRPRGADRAHAADRPVADVAGDLLDALRGLGGGFEIDPTPQEVSWTVPLDEDREHATYHPDEVAAYFAAAAQAALVLAAFRAPYRGRSTPVNAWWGSSTWRSTGFSGAPAEPPSDDFIMRNSMDAQEVAIGWWPGDPRFGRAAFYAYAHPPADDFPDGELEPRAARWDAELGLFRLDWADVLRGRRPPLLRARVRPLGVPPRVRRLRLGPAPPASAEGTPPPFSNGTYGAEAAMADAREACSVSTWATPSRRSVCGQRPASLHDQAEARREPAIGRRQHLDGVAVDRRRLREVEDYRAPAADRLGEAVVQRLGRGADQRPLHGHGVHPADGIDRQLDRMLQGAVQHVALDDRVPRSIQGKPGIASRPTPSPRRVGRARRRSAEGLARSQLGIHQSRSPSSCMTRRG